MKNSFSAVRRLILRSKFLLGIAVVAAALMSITGATSAYAGTGTWTGSSNSPPLYYYNELSATAWMVAPTYPAGTPLLLTSIAVSGDTYNYPYGTGMESAICLNSASTCYGYYAGETYSVSFSGVTGPSEVAIYWMCYQSSTYGNGTYPVIPNGPINSLPTKISVAYSY
jgi:hypothetical protein